MPSIFKKQNHKASKPSSFIRSTSSISYGDDVDILPTLVTSPRGRARKLRVLTTGRFDSTMISISSTSVSSNSSASNAALFHRPLLDIADLVLQPDHYTTLLSQASPNRDPNERPPIPTSTAPGTERQSSKISLLDVPPSNPFSQESMSMDLLPAIFVNEVDSEVSLMEGITYDTILVSTLHKNLGMMEDIPATRTPASRLAAIQEGGFGSLMGASMAIMQGRT